MTEAAERGFREAIERIEKVSAVEVVVVVRPRLWRWLVPHIVLGMLVMLAVLAFELFSEDYEFELWTILVLAALTPLAGALLVELIPPLARIATPARVVDPMLATAAHAAFHEMGVHGTRMRTGLLVFVALHERRVALAGDRAIVDHVGEPGLQRRARMLEEKLTAGGEAVAAALAAMAPDFAAALPRTEDDVNELSDVVHVRAPRPQRFRGRAA